MGQHTPTHGADDTGGRGRLIAMGISYAMGNFNDNFFKQAGLVLAAAAGLTGIQGMATMAYALPFVLFSAWTGWLADRLPKGRIIVGAKLLELVAMVVAAVSLYVMSWYGVVLVLLIMGLQATFFSPAINGAIPENFPEVQVPRVNAVIKLVTTAAILLGIAMAGPFLDISAPHSGLPLPQGRYAFGRAAVGVFAILIAIVGLASALCIRGRTPATFQPAPFPLLGPVHSVLHALECRRQDRALFLALVSEAYFYFLSSFVVLCITNLGVALGLSMTGTGLLATSLMVGVGLGAMVSGRWPASVWPRYIGASGKAMALALTAASLGPLLPEAARFFWVLGLLGIAGVCGGLYLIPVGSCIQVRPAEHEKGRILGISGFACFLGITLSGPLFSVLSNPASVFGPSAASFDLSPAVLLGGAGLASFAFMVGLGRKLARLPGSLAAMPPGGLGLFLRMVLPLRYHVTVRGLDRIPSGGPILFLPNHPALIDPFIIHAQLAGARPRPLADEERMSGFWGRFAVRAANMVTIPDLGHLRGKDAARKVEESLSRLIDALRQGDSVLLYPAGRIYRSDREMLGGNSGVARILQAVPEARVVLARSTGLWGSSFSFAPTGKSPAFISNVLRGMGILLANGIFFTPRRKVDVEFTEPADLPKNSGRKRLNARLEMFYNAKTPPPMGVPLFFWQGSTPYKLSRPAAIQGHDSRKESIDAALREKVLGMLREASGREAFGREAFGREAFGEDTPGRETLAPLDDAMLLNADLGLDSLAVLELALKLEARFGHVVPAPENLLSVGDCILAAAGLLAEVEAEAQPAPRWFEAGEWVWPLRDATLPQAFLRQVRRAPGAPLTGERSGVLTRLDTLTMALILADHVRALPGVRVGIMLPAVAAVLPVWLGVMLAGKEAVFLNWTTGIAGLRHAVALAEIRCVISAAGLWERLQSQGLPLDGLPVAWTKLEEFASGLSKKQKLAGALHARLHARLPLSLARHPVAETAAVLFTSGSEALPKGVPLSHANLLTDAKEVMEALGLRAKESLGVILPPFHSFGLLAGAVMPLAFGLRAAFYPNPMSPVRVAALVRDFKPTVLPATPAFLAAVLEKAKGTEALDSVRYAFVGAEACPEQVYRDFAEQCPKAVLCEGYGVTECSPVLSVNRPDDALPGSLGHVLASVEAAVVKWVDGEKEGGGRLTDPAAEDEPGLLLVRGPNVFKGYLPGASDTPASDTPASPFVEYAGKTWYSTGDFVRRDASGRLFFVGRSKRFVKKSGEMISLPALEDALLKAFGTRPNAPNAPDGPDKSGGQVLAVEAGASGDITLFSPIDLTEAEANAALRAAGFSALYSVRRFVKVDAVPLLGTGKTDYRRLKEML